MKRIGALLLVILPFMAFARNEHEYQKTSNGIESNLLNMNVVIEFYSLSTVRVFKKPHGDFVSKKSLSVTKKPENVKIRIKEKEDDPLFTDFDDAGKKSYLVKQVFEALLSD